MRQQDLTAGLYYLSHQSIASRMPSEIIDNKIVGKVDGTLSKLVNSFLTWASCPSKRRDRAFVKPEAFHLMGVGESFLT